MNLETLKSFFTQLFTSLDTEDSVAVLVILAITFLLGLIFGALSRGKKIRQLKKMVKERDNDLITVRAENGAFKEKLEIAEENLQKAQQEYETTNSLLGEMETDRNQVRMKWQESNNLVQQLKTEQATTSRDIDELNETILDLQLKNDQLKQQLIDQSNAIIASNDTSSTTTTTTSSTGADNDRMSHLEDKLEQLQSENISLRSDLIDIKGQSGVVSDNSLAAIKARLEQLELENDRLQADLTGLKSNTTSVSTITEPISLENRQASSRSALNAAFGTKLKRVNATDKDNLKLIDGIGPFIENKLNDIGIYSYEQIAQFDTDLIEHVTNAIQFFPGRIERDDWVGQARKLMS